MIQLHNADGFKFYRSANDVILCPGDENGLLPPKYFSEVRALPSGRIEVVLWFLKQKKSTTHIKEGFNLHTVGLGIYTPFLALNSVPTNPSPVPRLIHLYQPVLFSDSFTCTNPSYSQTHSLVPTLFYRLTITCSLAVTGGGGPY